MAGRNGGNGFSGAWVAREGVLTVSADGYTYDTLPVDGGRVGDLTGASSFANRPFDTTGWTDPGDVLWFSLLVNFSSTASDLRVKLFASDTAYNSGTGFRMIAGNPNGTIQVESGYTLTGTTASLSRSATHLIVGRLAFVAGSNNDQVHLWIDPTLGVEPALTAAQAISTTQDIAVNGGWLAVRGGGSFTGSVDEFRLGDSWLAVTRGSPAEVVAAPDISPNGGDFVGSVLVSLTSATEGASIRYTLDGSTPTETVGTLYSGPIEVSASLTLQATGYKEGAVTSAVSSADFNSLPVIVAAALPKATVGEAYSASLSVTGGDTPFIWSIVAGTLPPGLSLDPNGIISGTPTQAGMSGFEVGVVDGDRDTDQSAFTLEVLPSYIGGGHETFLNWPLTSGSPDPSGSWTSTQLDNDRNTIVWNYIKARGNTLDGPCVFLRVPGQSSLTAQLYNGLSEVSFTAKAHSAGAVRLEVRVNGVSLGVLDLAANQQETVTWSASASGNCQLSFHLLSLDVDSRLYLDNVLWVGN